MDIPQKVSAPPSGLSNDLPGHENVFQPEDFNLLPVFHSLCEVHLEKEKAIRIAAQTFLHDIP